MGICKNHHSLQTKLCSHSNSSALEDSTVVLQLLSRCPYCRTEMGFVICNEDFSGLGIYPASMSSMHPVQWGREDNSNWLISLAQLWMFRIPTLYQGKSISHPGAIRQYDDASRLCLSKDHTLWSVFCLSPSCVCCSTPFETCYMNKPAFQNGYQILWSFFPTVLNESWRTG